VAVPVVERVEEEMDPATLMLALVTAPLAIILTALIPDAVTPLAMCNVDAVISPAVTAPAIRIDDDVTVLAVN